MPPGGQRNRPGQSQARCAPRSEGLSVALQRVSNTTTMAEVPDSKSGPCNGGVGSSPTFGTEIGYFLSTTRTPLGAISEDVLSNVSRIWLMTPVRPRRFRGRTGLALGSPRK